jgi:hypothetical protein
MLVYLLTFMIALAPSVCRIDRHAVVSRLALQSNTKRIQSDDSDASWQWKFCLWCRCYWSTDLPAFRDNVFLGLEER